MATIKPFRGCRYDVAAVGNLSAVICPPYDMIGPELKSELQQRSPYNAVHLEGGEQPDPVDPQAGYQQAAARFEDWLAEGKLCREDAPAFYVMRHAYNFGGRHYQHLGLFADVLVEDYDAGAVLPHEFTREPSVLDRVALLDACQAQFSPIMSLYRDSEGGLRTNPGRCRRRVPGRLGHDSCRRQRRVLVYHRRLTPRRPSSIPSPAGPSSSPTATTVTKPRCAIDAAGPTPNSPTTSPPATT